MWTDSISTYFHTLIFAGRLELLLSGQLQQPQLNHSPHCWNQELKRHV